MVNLARLQADWRKWRAIFSIYFQDGLAYRASGLIWIMTDVTIAVTMPLVWVAAGQGQDIAGFSGRDFILYYLFQLLLGSFITSHLMWEISMEIKEGQFSTMLLRPVNYYALSFFRNLAWRVIRPTLFFPFFLLLLFAYRSYLTNPTLYLGFEFWLALILGHLVSFAFVMMMSMIALFVQEATSIFELYYVPLMFLSGQLFPISVLPDWARNLAMIFPFYYTSGLPTEILIGRVGANAAWQGIGAQLVWIVFAYAGFRFLWSRGLRHYTGVGM